MAKVELGEKRVCPECGAKFYDLTKRPAVCPKCQHSFDPEALEAANIPVPVAPLKPEKDNGDNDIDEEEVDEEEIDEAEDEARELELDGDDATLIASARDEDDSSPDISDFSTDDDDDDDAALLDEDDNDLPPPDDGNGDAEEIEI